MNRTITHPVAKESQGVDSYEKGKIFEDYIVTLFNQKKFRLLEWRSDKKATNGVIPVRSLYPDLEFLYLGKKSFHFAIECKWRKQFYEGLVHWADNYKIDNYRNFQYQQNITVLIAIGIGGSPSSPEKLFVTPLNHICMYTNVFESHLMPYKRNPKNKIDDTEQLKLF